MPNRAPERHYRVRRISTATEKIPWHPAFVQALQLELEDYADALEFRPEYPLTTEPLRIDAVVVKKKPGVTIDKNIGRIFRTHNIFEFKGPRDNFSADDLTKTFAYVFLYAAIVRVDVRDCTLTLIGAKKPAVLMDYVREALGYRVEKHAEGMYYVDGATFPVQIVQTRRLSARENLWLNSLRDDLTARNAERLLGESGKKSAAQVSAYLYALMTAHTKAFTEVWDMTKRQKEFEQFMMKVTQDLGLPEKWHQEGARQKTLETARKMRNLGIPAETIGQVTDLSPADIAAL